MKEEENTSRQVKDTSLSLKDSILSISYTKTNKLIVALFMVTDIMDKEESIRQKLRELGSDIISDTHNIFFNPRFVLMSVKQDVLGIPNLLNKITQILSFLDIASAVKMISEMNASILKREFIELKDSILEYERNLNVFGGKSTLSEFFIEDEKTSQHLLENDRNNYIGHTNSTRIGVQKGSTLMKALSDRINRRPIENNKRPLENKMRSLESNNTKNVIDFDLLKKQRRYEIVQAIKDYPLGASITDIKSKLEGVFLSTSEKTLQRELVSMVHDSVLKKTGNKRWSRYSLL